MRLFTVKQIRELDQKTLVDRKIASMELMEQAAIECAQWILTNVSKKKKIVVVAGIGNNGGDGVAITRMLHFSGYNIQLYVSGNVRNGSSDFYTNYSVLKQRVSSVVADKLPELDDHTVIIDALFGSGLSRPVAGDKEELIQQINDSPCQVISIDIPSGMPADPVESPEQFSTMVQADVTLTLQMPKLNMLLADHGNAVGRMVIVPIGISPEAIEKTPTRFFYTGYGDLKNTIKPRLKFTHKGDNGHVLLVAGNPGMAGAAYLAANAAFRCGSGLVTVSASDEVTRTLQINSPEVICRNDIPEIRKYSSVAVGPGIGREKLTIEELVQVINDCKEHDKPVVVDADGLNILADHKEDWPEGLFKGAVLTPHPREFDRLFGPSSSHSDRLQRATEAAQKYEAIIVLKGAYTSIHMNDQVYFNSTGNPGMATAGSGDILTGVITTFLGIPGNRKPEESVVLAVFTHGLAGDIARERQGDILIARDIIRYLPEAIAAITDHHEITDEETEDDAGFF